MSEKNKKRIPKKYKAKAKKGGVFSFYRTRDKGSKMALAPNPDQLSMADDSSKRERKGSLIKMRFSSFVNTLTNITGRKNEIDLDTIADVSHVQQHHKLDAKTFKTDSKDFEAVLKESGITGEDLVKHRDEVLHVIQTNMLNAVSAPPTKKEVHETFEDAVDVVRDDPIRYFTKDSKIADSDNFEVWRCIPKPKTIIPFLIKHRPVSGVSYVTAKICEVVSPVEVFSEIALLSLCKGHSNIVEYIYTYFSGKSTCLWIVCEYMESSIADILFHCETINGYRQMGSPWKDKYISYVLREILQAVEFLHRHYRIHRNLKCENFLWNQSGQVKLTHFGDAVTLTAEESKRKSKINTDFWSPPELLKDEEYDRAVDIWSLGISLIELATGDPPFRVRETQVRAMLLIIVEAAPRLPKSFGDIPAHYSEDCEHLVELMCSKDPEERPSAAELLMHPYFQNACAKEDFAKYAKRMKQGFL